MRISAALASGSTVPYNRNKSSGNIATSAGAARLEQGFGNSKPEETSAMTMSTKKFKDSSSAASWSGSLASASQREHTMVSESPNLHNDHENTLRQDDSDNIVSLSELQACQARLAAVRQALKDKNIALQQYFGMNLSDTAAHYDKTVAQLDTQSDFTMENIKEMANELKTLKEEEAGLLAAMKQSSRKRKT
jgi:hypothetical protein